MNSPSVDVKREQLVKARPRHREINFLCNPKTQKRNKPLSWESKSFPTPELEISKYSWFSQEKRCWNWKKATNALGVNVFESRNIDVKTWKISLSGNPTRKDEFFDKTSKKRNQPLLWESKNLFQLRSWKFWNIRGFYKQNICWRWTVVAKKSEILESLSSGRQEFCVKSQQIFDLRYHFASFPEKVFFSSFLIFFEFQQWSFQPSPTKSRTRF